MEHIIGSQNTGKIMKEQQKSFCFADVQRNDFWDKNISQEVGRQKADYFDKIYYDIIMKNF